jgi:hypothetical protein
MGFYDGVAMEGRKDGDGWIGPIALSHSAAIALGSHLSPVFMSGLPALGI